MIDANAARYVLQDVNSVIKAPPHLHLATRRNELMQYTYEVLSSGQGVQRRYQIEVDASPRCHSRHPAPWHQAVDGQLGIPEHVHACNTTISITFG